MRAYACLALVAACSASSPQSPLHLATAGLLQISPSFSGDGISLYPAHHPAHNASDLEHLIPRTSKELYYSQEGHRPAKHGAKHGSLTAEYKYPTVVLDHTSHLSSINCSRNRITAKFRTQQAFEHVETQWSLPQFLLVTFHKSCGDEFHGKRSYFLAENATFDRAAKAVSVKSTPIEQNDVLHSGEIQWGTYKNPAHRERTPVKGHIRLSKPEPAWRNKKQATQAAQAAKARAPRKRELVSLDGKVTPGDGGIPESDLENEPLPKTLADEDGGEGGDEGDLVDLNTNRSALINFFGTSKFDQTDFDQPMSPEDELVFADTNGTIPTEAEEDAPSSMSKRGRQLRITNVSLNCPDRSSPSFRDSPCARYLERRGGKRQAPVRHPDGTLISLRRPRPVPHLAERGIAEFFQGLFNAITEFFETIADFFVSAFNRLAHIAFVITEIAVLAAKLIAVPFGVPFDESYHHDFNFDHTVDSDITKSGSLYTVQCSDCGIHGDFTVDGRLAFSIDSGVTEGSITLVNHDPFTINAVFGLTVEVEKAQSVPVFTKQIAAVPLGALAIPGIITLGPEATISGELDLSLNGKAEFTVGAKFSLSPGTAALDLIDKEKNKLEGLTPNFTPVFNFTGTVTATAELGLPVALEVGLDILNGKFKKTVALVDKPSVYASVTSTTDETADCPNGADIRAGIKNRIYASAFDLWDYDLDETVLYEKQLACVTANGFDTSAETSDDGAIKNIVDEKGSDISMTNEKINNVAEKLKEHQSKTGFRLIMDEDKTSILVSGKDGYLYLVDSTEEYDASSPWGTIRMDSPGVDIDVFGRIMAFFPDIQYLLSTEVRVWNPSEIPNSDLACALASLKDENGQETGNIGVFLTVGGDNYMYYPTFCKTKYGLRMYSTGFPINKFGYVTDTTEEKAQNLGPSLANFPDVELDCKTVKLRYA